MRFLVEFVDGQSMPLRALGMALDGDYLLFFRRWPEDGGSPIGHRVPRNRIRRVRIDEEDTPDAG